MENKVNEKLKLEAKKAFKEKDLRLIIGYSGDEEPVPAFVENEEEASKLTFTPLCANNLVTYLVDELKSRKDKKPVGIVVKGCDSKTIIQLLNENIINRNDLYIIGVPCEGIIDRRLLDEKLKKEGCSLEKTKLDVRDGKVFVNSGSKQYVYPLKAVVHKKCVNCTTRNPVIFDVLLRDKVIDDEEDYSEIAEIEKMSLDERWKFWENVFGTCIRCHACKKSCPLCYCEECAIDPTEIVIKPDTTAEDKANRPRWIERSPVLSENIVYHLARILHLAGRCVDCGECERVCPQRLPLRKLTKKMEKDVKTMFKYEAGKKLGLKPFSALSDLSDDNDFIM